MNFCSAAPPPTISFMAKRLSAGVPPVGISRHKMSTKAQPQMDAYDCVTQCSDDADEEAMEVQLPGDEVEDVSYCLHPEDSSEEEKPGKFSLKLK